MTERSLSNPGFPEHRATCIPPIAEGRVAPSSHSIYSVHTASSVGTASSTIHTFQSVAFESILGKTRVYRRAGRNTSTNSFKTIRSSWSQLSGLTLADVSDISVICLPVCVSELSNAYLYQEGPKTAGVVSGNQLERVRHASGRIRAEVWYRLKIANGVKGVALLHEAAGKGYVEVVRTMLQNREVHEDATDSSGATAIHHSAQNGHIATLRLLVDQGANVDAPTKDGRTALHYSAQRGHHEATLLLLDRGANTNATTIVGGTALHYSAVWGRTATVELLLGRGAKIDAATEDGKTALHCSAERGHDETLQLLLGRGANINAATNRGETALHHSAERGYTGTVHLLLGRGANIDAVTEDGETALLCSAVRRNDETIQLLLNRGANINAAAKALRCPPGQRYGEALQLLPDEDANIDTGNAGSDELFSDGTSILLATRLLKWQLIWKNASIWGCL